MSEHLDLSRLSPDPSVKWYYRTANGGVSEAVSVNKLRSLLDSRTLSLESEVWNSRLGTDWCKVQHLLEGRLVVPEKIAAADGEWFYVSRGARLGPVSQETLERLISQGDLLPTNEVWKSSFGTQWKSAAEAGLFSANNPPQIPPNAINDNLAWALAIVPILIFFFKAILVQTTLLGLPIGVAQMNGADITPVLYYPPILGVIMNSGLCIWDTTRLRRAGWQINSLMVLGLFLTPVYLFVRASKLKQSPYYAYAWIACFMLTLIW